MHDNSKLRRTIFKNASANLVRLVGSGIVALSLPPFLVRRLPKDTYSAWALLLQLTLYVGLLDFGIQTAVARYVAHADELEDQDQRDGIASTAVSLLAVAGALGCCLVVILAWRLPQVFRDMPVHLQRGATIGLLLMGGSFALGLPFSVIHAVFIGLQRNEIPVAIVVTNRIAMAALTLGVVFKHLGLAAMGAAVAFANVLSYAGSYFAWRIWAPGLNLRISLVSKVYAMEIASYSAAVAVWFAGMLMVSGLDLTIVGIFDYKATAYYAVAVTLTNFVIQTQGAIFAALLPASAALNARGDAQKLGTLLVSSTRYGMLILLATALPLLLGGKYILRFWVGAVYAEHSTLLMEVLVVASVVRLSVLPYATLLLGTGQQRKVIMSPLAEGITNIIASIVGAHLFGAVGVAIGTLIGSFVGVGLHLTHNMPRTSAIAVNRLALVKEGLFRPLVCACPFGLLLLSQVMRLYVSTGVSLLFLAIATLSTGFLLWNYGLVSAERRKLEHVFRLS
jgi:O-antigen/teichoic acid export membrane protein